MRAMRTWMTVVLILGFALAVAWAGDSITLQGERTVYTVECRDGSWQQQRCGGTLAAGARYRFRALRAHNEVVFWTVGAVGEPSGKYAGCRIADGRNWSCPPNADAKLTVTLQMVRGVPLPDPSGSTRSFHSVAKWRWWLATLGLPIGSEADN